jgi:isopentenyldiphosphate isomerase
MEEIDVEIWDLYDINGNKTGKTMERGAEVPTGTYHLGVDVWIMNSKGELLIQKRAKSKESYPDMWAMTGGSALKGENAKKAIRREANEELGIDLQQSELELINKIRTPRTFIHVFFVKKDIEIEELKLQEEEVADAKWVTLEEIDELVNEGKFIKTRWDEVRDIMYKKRI